MYTHTHTHTDTHTHMDILYLHVLGRIYGSLVFAQLRAGAKEVPWATEVDGESARRSAGFESRLVRARAN